MIEAKILFLGLILFCDKADPAVCTGDEISDNSAVRGLVLDLSANAFNCSEDRCYVCPDMDTELGFHTPVLIFRLSDTNLDECNLCPQLSKRDQPPPDLCCLDLYGKQVTVHAGRGSTLRANRRLRSQKKPQDRYTYRHAYDWIAGMSYFESDLELMAPEYLQPGEGYNNSRPRVAAWVDFDDGELGSTLLARGSARNSKYVLWKRDPSTPPANHTALAESLLWEKTTQSFSLVVEDDSGTELLDFKKGARSKVRVVVSNLPGIPLEITDRQLGYDTAEHFKAYYNIFRSPEGCHQPHRVEDGGDYYSGGVDLLNWLLGVGDLPVVVDGETVLPADFTPPAAGVSGDNAVCSPSKFP